MSGFQEYFGEIHSMVRQTVRKFVEREISPFVDDWEEKGEFPKELYAKAGDAGILGIGYPEAYGGSAGDTFVKIAATEELMRCGSGGVAAGLGSLDIGIPPILALGTEEQKSRFIPPVLRGEKIAALGITEPNAGSDVANIRTKAVRKDDHYVVNGSKMFITSGARANLLTCAVRTGGEGSGGVSLLVMESEGAPRKSRKRSYQNLFLHLRNEEKMGTNKQKDQYAEAGVDIEAGNRFVDLIKPIVSRTHRSGVITDIGGFAGLFSLNVEHIKNPVL
ncbi:MAG: acyl-CoA dehydrogenase family protein, partial [Desulfobacteraceae bacterium]|nr:acyl-CoA dehydrogenase family protein [Desulfobacteraceae bacterium]